MKFSKRTHRLIMIQFWNSTPSYDTKLDLLDRLKRTNFVNFQPFYDSQVGHFMGKVTFSCASMMMEPGLTVEDCPNKNVCGTIRQLTDEDRVELHYARMENALRTLDTMTINVRSAALYLLSTRACPQTPASLGVPETLERLRSKLSLVEETIAQLSEGCYVAPIGVEAHRYVVKRPYGAYQYNKLTSREAIFPPQAREDWVKVIHLSSDYDSRNFEGRAGIERRNRLLALDTAICAAEDLLNRAIAVATNPPVDEVVARKIAYIPLEDGDVVN